LEFDKLNIQEYFIHLMNKEEGTRNKEQGTRKGNEKFNPPLCNPAEYAMISVSDKGAFG